MVPSGAGFCGEKCALRDLVDLSEFCARLFFAHEYAFTNQQPVTGKAN